MRSLRTLSILVALALSLAPVTHAQRPLRVFISVDMEGIGGVGTEAMTATNGRDYALAR